MEVTRKLRQTEAGVLPQEWSAPSLADVLESTQLGGNYKNGERPTNWPLIKMGNLGRGSITIDRLQFIDGSQPPHPRDLLEVNDILFNTRNTLDLVGKVAIWRGQLPAAYFNSNLLRMTFDRALVSSPEFMNYVLNTEKARQSLRAIATGTTSVAAIYGKDLARVQVPLPPAGEQTAIASALSDADALIESLEQLLAKKRHLKQGAMQVLLTGKKRLPGFAIKTAYTRTEAGVIPADWGVSTVGSEFSVQLGKMLDAEKNVGVLRPFLGNRAVQWGRIETTDIGEVRLTSSDMQRFRLRHGDLLVCEGGEVGRAAIWRQPLGECYYQKALHRLRPSRGYNVEFMLHLLHRLAATGVLTNYVTQTSIAHLPKDKFETVPIPLPSRAEQDAITGVLSEMDAETAALEAKLTKARQIKQGMMQELLTGRIRLV